MAWDLFTQHDGYSLKSWITVIEGASPVLNIPRLGRNESHYFHRNHVMILSSEMPYHIILPKAAFTLIIYPSVMYS